MPRAMKNWPPVAKLSLLSQAGRAVTVSTSGTHAGSTGPNKAHSTPSTIANWTLFWGDGTQDAGSGTPPLTLPHTYNTDYPSVTVRLTVVDANTLTASATLTLSNVIAPQPPSSPTNLGATAISDTAIDLAWTDTQGAATSYLISRGPISGSISVVATISGTLRVFHDTGLTPATGYQYRVQGANGVGASDYSNTATATTFPTTPPPTPPAAPSSLTAALVGSLQVNLAWTDNSSDESGFQLERSDAGGPFRLLATLGAGATTYSDLNLNYFTLYAYRIRAYNAAGNSSYTNTASITTPAAPPPPVPAQPLNLVATALTPNTVGLTWIDASTDETGFTLQRKAGGGNFAALATLPANATTYSDSTALPSTVYTYRLAAFNGNGTSPFTTSNTITTPAAPPPSPPTCTLGTTGAVTNGTPVTFTMTATPGSAALASWTLAVGDGQTLSGSGAPPSTRTYLYSLAGTYNATLTVRDVNNATGTAVTTATVNAVTPPPPPPPPSYVDISSSTPDVNAIVNGYPTGQAFRFLNDGVHRIAGQITPRNGQTFLRQAGAVISGARKLTGWTQTGAYWYVGGQSGSQGSGANCAPGFPRCDYPNELFIDDVRIRAVDSLAGVTANTWFFDFGASRVYIGTDPTNRTIELSQRPFAFGGGAQNVTYNDLLIEKFSNPAQLGAFGGDTNSTAIGPGWIVNGGEVRLCHGLGLHVGNTMQVLGTLIHDHGQMGIGGGGTGVLVDGIQSYNNNASGFNYGWEGGGSKFVATLNLTVRNSTFRNNLGPGLWLDIDNKDFSIYQNHCNDNNGALGCPAGIFIEISYAGTIYNNEVLRNGLSFNQWAWGSGIVIAASGGVGLTIYNNVLSGNAGGISLVQQPRGTGAFGPYYVQNVYVHDNQVAMATGLNGMVQDFGDNAIFTSRNNRYDYNRYTFSGDAAFAFNNGPRDWPYWQGTAGQDLHGSMN